MDKGATKEPVTSTPAWDGGVLVLPSTDPSPCIPAGWSCDTADDGLG